MKWNKLPLKNVKKNYIFTRMLTKNDLSQIENIVEKRTRKIVQEETRKIVREEIEPVKSEIRTIKKDIAKIRADIKVIISFFDREYLELRTRVERIKAHLGLSPS